MDNRVYINGIDQRIFTNETRNTNTVIVSDRDCVRLKLYRPMYLSFYSFKDYVMELDFKVEGPAAAECTVELDDIVPADISKFLTDIAPCRLEINSSSFINVPSDPVEAMLYIKSKCLEYDDLDLM
jgi:hypothetical protein